MAKKEAGEGDRAADFYWVKPGVLVGLWLQLSFVENPK